VVNFNGTTFTGLTGLFSSSIWGGTGAFNVTSTFTLINNLGFSNYSTMNVLSGATFKLNSAIYGGYGTVTGGGNMTLNSGATLDNYSGNSTMQQSALVLNNAQITNSGGGTFTISDNITGTGTVSGVTAITSGATASGGVLTVTGAPGVTGTSLGSSSGSGANLTAAAGSTLILKGLFTEIMPGNITGGSGLVELSGATIASTNNYDVQLYSGKVSGYGTVSAPVLLQGLAVVAADGLGTGPQTLSFTNAITPVVTNTGGAGWFAQNQGKLSLAAVNVTGAGSYNWGGDPTTYKLVNSIGMTFGGSVTPGSLAIALLSSDRGDVPAGLVDPIGVWSFNPGTLTFGSASLTFRYDDALAAALPVSPTDLALWGYNGSQWVIIPTSPIDTTNDLLTTSSGLSSFYQDYAIAKVPEPSTMILVALGGLGAFWRKRTRTTAV
jgi:hypothetical protein